MQYNQTVLSVLIVEDNIQQLKFIQECIQTYPMLNIVCSCRNGKDALDVLESKAVDLLLSDIHLPELSGLELLENLEKPPYVIFITAYDKYALRAFELGAIDYVLKPFTEERLESSINRFLAYFDTKEILQKKIKELGLSFKSHGICYFIGFHDICYFTASGKNTIIHTEDKDFEASGLMKNFESILPADMFSRVHRKHIVNLSFVFCIQSDRINFNLILKNRDDSSIPVSKKYQTEIKDLLHTGR